MITPRVETGIPGLDKLTGNGFINDSVTLVTGEAGTGKTIFCLQFLWHGLKRGETCIFVTLEENPDDIKADAKMFGWDFDKYEKRGLFRLIYHDPAQVNNLGSVIIDEINTVKAKRLVIDSTSLIGLNLQDVSKIRKTLYSLINVIKRNKCTAIITAEIPEGVKGLSKFGVEEFVVDGIIVLNYLEYAAGGMDRSLIIRKMRRTNHGKDIYPIDITSKGIVIKPVE
jgi:KaiC/GvpD/RAD55 family RecA-like ATPase